MSSITSSDPSASEAAELKVMISCEREDEPENKETGRDSKQAASNETEENEDDLSHLSLIPMLKKIGTEWTRYEWKEWKCDIKFIGKQSWNTLLLGLRYQLT